MSPLKPLVFTISMGTSLACAPAQPGPQTAAEHEEAATEHHHEADAHHAEAREHDRHAEQHAAMAKRLEAAVEGECREVLQGLRWACPLTHEVQEVKEVDGGVDIRFNDGTDIERKLQEMRCHHAYAASEGYRQAASEEHREMDTCPLYLPDVVMQISKDGKTITIQGESEASVDEIRERTHDHIMVYETDGHGPSLGPTGPIAPGL